MSQVLNLKKEKHQNPIIEISGAIDLGKTPIAQLIAKRIAATYISFPLLDPYSPTGRILLASLNNDPKKLEKNPNWWAHLYAANLYESKDKIAEAQARGPVVITNYTHAFKIWFNAFGLNVQSYVNTLPATAVEYILTGHDQFPSLKPKFDFSLTTKESIKDSFLRSRMKKAVRVPLENFYHRAQHAYANNIACAITTNIKRKFHLEVDELMLYKPDIFKVAI